MVTPHTHCSVCVVFEKLSVHLWMLRIELDFMIFFFFSDEAFNKKTWGKKKCEFDGFAAVSVLPLGGSVSDAASVL